MHKNDVEIEQLKYLLSSVKSQIRDMCGFEYGHFQECLFDYVGDGLPCNCGYQDILDGFAKFIEKLSQPLELEYADGFKE